MTRFYQAVQIIMTAFATAAGPHKHAQDESSAAAAPYEELYFDQLIAHDGSSAATYKQRYLLNTSHAGAGSLDTCPPILFYSGNEGDIPSFYSGNGFLTDYLAPKWGAVILFAEARYYGTSLPFGNESWTAENLKYLSTELILAASGVADYANLIRTLKATTLSAFAACPVISFGGSYGGTLTTFFRLSYPDAVARVDVIAGALAASAPIGYYDADRWVQNNVSAYTWTGVVARTYGAACMDAIAATNQALLDADADDLVTAFGLCGTDGLLPTQASLFQYALESLPQMDYSAPVGDLPAYPVAPTCAALANATSASERIAAAASISRLVAGAPDSGCWPALTEGPGGVPGDGPGPGSWGYQSCTETLHQFSSNTSLRVFDFNLTAQSDLCDALYGVRPDPRHLAETYGGYDIPSNVTNVFFSNGLLDPWSGGGFYYTESASSSNAFCTMPGGAHHSDLRGPREDDPSDVKECRAQEEAFLAAIVAEALL